MKIALPSDAMQKCCPDCGKPTDGVVDNSCPHCLLALGLTDDQTPADPNPEEQISTPFRALPGQCIGNYRLLEIIGEGGFGTVWMAEQQEPVRRRVALKILKLGMDTKEVVARFEAERQALALMDHPNIAHVYDGGATDTGRPYFVMELVRGVPITEYCDAQSLNTRERIDLFLSVCYAVQHAHQKGVIHRDLTPSNILVTQKDGKPVPKVVDFGIAKATAAPLTDKTYFTHFNQLIGTPVYMSPEQAGLGGLDIDSRSDVYSLGVLLYELLVGEVPFSGRHLKSEGHGAVLGAIREKDPLKPSTKLSTMSQQELIQLAARRKEEPAHLNKAMRGELDWLVLKALEKDRNRRYQTASALAADLHNYLLGEPITAAPPSLHYQLSKFAAKHRTGLTAAAALLIVLIAGIIATSWQALRATRLRDVAEKLRDEERTRLYASQMAIAFKSWDLGQAGRTRQILEEQIPRPGEKDLRGWEWRYLWGESRPIEKEIYPDQPGYVVSLGLSPNGRQLAVGHRGDGTIRIWDTARRQPEIERNVGRGIIDMIDFTPDGTGLFVSLRATNFMLLDAKTLADRAVFSGHSQPVCGVAADPAGRTVVSAAGDLYRQKGKAEMFVWDVSSRQILFKLPGTVDAALHPCFSSSGRYMSRALSRSELVEVWDMQERVRASAFKSPHGLVTMAAFSPDEQQLATCGQDGFIRLWNWRTHEELTALGRHAGTVTHVEFSHDGLRLLSAGADCTIRIWDMKTLSLQATLRGHRGRAQVAHFSPDGRWIVSAGGADETIRFWDANQRDRETLLDLGVESTARCEFNSLNNELCLLRLREDGTSLKIWHTDPAIPLANATPVRTATTPERILFTVLGQRLALAIIENEEISIQDSLTGREHRSLQSPAPLIGTLNASRDGHWLAAIGAPDRAIVWDAQNGRTAAAFQIPASVGPEPAAGSGAILFSADARILWIAHPNWNDIFMCDWRSGKVVKRLQGHSHGINSLALSSDGKLLASGSIDMTARLWDAATGDDRGVLPIENGGAISLSFSPDNKTLAVGCFDGQVKLWNIPAKSEIATLPGHMSIVYSVAFSPDTNTLVSASYDGTTRVWQAPPFLSPSMIGKNL